MTKGRSLQEHISEKMKEPEFRKAWNDLDAEFNILEMVIKAREEAGLTQEELARRIGTKQPALSRLETGGFQKAKIETLVKIANALNVKLTIQCQPETQGQRLTHRTLNRLMPGKRERKAKRPLEPFERRAITWVF
jgi:transcriptional regulator with XRE-family HTH domain